MMWTMMKQGRGVVSGRTLGVALTLVVLALGAPQSAIAQDAFTSYEVDLTDRSDDTFKVTVQFAGLSDTDDVFQFATTAPGTYQVMDIGRFVSGFTAMDAEGRTLEVEMLDANHWRFAAPERVHTVTYSIAETWDTPVEEHGQDRPFDENGLFEIIEEKTFGEIGDFFDSYIKAAEPLPIAEYFLKLGIRYDPAAQPRFKIMDDATPEQLSLRAAWLRLRPIA